MTSLYRAYSNDLDCEITIDEACDYFKEEIIRNPSNFQCAGRNCNGKVYCVNITKGGIQAPHFRSKGHSADCEFVKSLENESKEPALVSNKDCFLTQRPEKKEFKRGLSQQKKISKDVSNNNYQDPKVAVNSTSRYYRIHKIVEKYFELREKGDVSTSMISIDEQKISYKDLFRSLFNVPKDISTYTDHQVFWSTAFLNKKDGYYMINFTTDVKLGSEKKRPSFFIDTSKLEHYGISRLITKELVDFIDKSPVLVCVYGKINIKIKGEKQYVNIDYDSLDHICLKPASYLNRLKKS